MGQCEARRPPIHSWYDITTSKNDNIQFFSNQKEKIEMEIIFCVLESGSRLSVELLKILFETSLWIHQVLMQ